MKIIIIKLPDVDGVNDGLVNAPPELDQLPPRVHVPQPDDGARAGGRGQDLAVVGEAEAAEGGVVGEDADVTLVHAITLGDVKSVDNRAND